MREVQDKTVEISENVEQNGQDMETGKNHTGIQGSGIHLSNSNFRK